MLCVGLAFLVAKSNAVVRFDDTVAELEHKVYGVKVKVDDIDIRRGGRSGALPQIGQPHTLWSPVFRPLDSPLKFLLLRGASTRDPNQRRPEEVLADLDLPSINVLLGKRIKELDREKVGVIDKMFEQRMYWELFDVVAMLAIEQPHPSVITSVRGRLSPSVDPAQVKLATDNLVALIRKLSLSASDIDSLFALKNRAESNEIIDKEKLFGNFSEWYEISNKLGLASHSALAADRSYFRSYVKFPAEAHLGVKQWIERVKAGLKEGRVRLPKPPSGTQFALVRFMLAINQGLEIVALPIVEQVTFRTYLTHGAREDYENYSATVLDALRTRKQGMLAYRTLAENDYVWAGLLIGAPDYVLTAGQAILLTLKDSCFACHGNVSPGPGDALSLAGGMEVTPGVTGDQSLLAIEAKKHSHGFRYLVQSNLRRQHIQHE